MNSKAADGVKRGCIEIAVIVVRCAASAPKAGRHAVLNEATLQAISS